MTNITETIGRSALLAAASNYQSVAEALMELIDNPFDKRRGRHLTIDIRIDKKRDRVTITDIGGEGMNDEGLQGWIRWGEGEQHEQGDIGQYRVGGKLAAIYLAEGLEIVCRKANNTAIWRFEDPHWGSRTKALSESPLGEVPPATIRWPDGAPSKDVGFTRVTLTGLRGHRYEIGVLRERLADTYRSLIEEGQCTILVQGTAVEERQTPWSSSIGVNEIPKTQVFKGVYILGSVGAIDRDQVPEARGVRIPAGIRTEFNGRKISDGEEFGFKLSGKGNLQRVYGEIQIRGRGIKPNQLKTGWPQDSEAWASLEAFMHEQMQPIVSQLNRLSEVRPVSREQKDRAKKARDRAQEAFKKLERLRNHPGGQGLPEGHGPEGVDAPGGRRIATPKGGCRPQPQGRTRGRTKNRTPAPEGSVGRLLRLVTKTGRMPSVDYAALGAQIPRTQWRDNDDKTRAVVINTDHPLFATLGSQEDYVFDSLVMHLVHDEVSSVRDARDLIEQIIWLDRETEEAA
ncbi:MAG: ATP-binding protein [Chloroflexi bacterium]|nr:ATP-binding protein [Chloroflexota bacterium]